jgi:hypothetical protein
MLQTSIWRRLITSSTSPFGGRAHSVPLPGLQVLQGSETSNCEAVLQPQIVPVRVHRTRAAAGGSQRCLASTRLGNPTVTDAIVHGACQQTQPHLSHLLPSRIGRHRLGTLRLPDHQLARRRLTLSQALLVPPSLIRLSHAAGVIIGSHDDRDTTPRSAVTEVLRITNDVARDLLLVLTAIMMI